MAIQNIPAASAQVIARPAVTGTRETMPTDNVARVETGQRAAPVQETEASTQAQETTALPGREQVDQAMNEVRKALDPVARNLQFSIDEDTGRTVIKVVDSSTQEVIRQMPSEEFLALTRSLDSLSGLFVKQKA